MPTPAALRPLRSRAFALVWGSAMVSNIGSWMQTVAVGLLVTTRTGQAGWAGLVAAAGFVPIGLLSPVGGALADRVPIRRWLLATTLGETALAAVLAAVVAAGRPGPGLVTLLVLGGGCVQALGIPGFQALVPQLVGADDLRAAISLNSAQFNLGRVVGPLLAGVTVVAGGYAWAFAVNAASFAAVLVALLVLRLPPAPLPADAGVGLVERLAVGARAVRDIAPARAAVSLVSLLALTASPFIALVPAMATKVLHDGAAGTSALVTAQGVGAVTGALALPAIAARLGARRALALDVAVLCVALAGYGLAPSLAAACVALAVVGAAYIGVLAGCSTAIQLSAPDGLRGRMLGINLMALGLLYPLGAVVQGRLADIVGLRLVTAGGAAVLAVVVAVTGRRLLADPPAAPALAEVVAVPEPPEA
ncbi:MAG TPA: MFS transporter [Acidimicrobiales bacterium]|nr:MFS transporter [Acidimicrobiales bacterium]